MPLILTYMYADNYGTNGFYFSNIYFSCLGAYMLYVFMYINELITQTEYKDGITQPNKYEKPPFFMFLDNRIIGGARSINSTRPDTKIKTTEIRLPHDRIYVVFNGHIRNRVKKLYDEVIKTKTTNKIFSYYQEVIYNYKTYSFYLNNAPNNFVSFEIKHNYNVLKHIQLQLKQTRNKDKKISLVYDYHTICNINDTIAKRRSLEQLKKIYSIKYNKIIAIWIKYVNNLYLLNILNKTFNIALNKVLRSPIYNYGLGLKLSKKNCGIELTD